MDNAIEFCFFIPEEINDDQRSDPYKRHLFYQTSILLCPHYHIQLDQMSYIKDSVGPSPDFLSDISKKAWLPSNEIPYNTPRILHIFPC